MKLSELRMYVRGRIPGAKTTVITNTLIDQILNNAYIDITYHADCLPANKKFNVTADQQEYLFSTVIGNYLKMDKEGLWHNRGTASATDWKHLDPATLHGVSQNTRPKWRDLDSDTPMEYSVDGDTLTLIPAPDTTLANGLWLYYIAKPTIMTAEEHYPFSGSSVEYTHLSIFDEAAIMYCRWKIEPMLNEKANEERLRTTYFQEVERQKQIFMSRRDIENFPLYAMIGPKVR